MFYSPPEVISGRPAPLGFWLIVQICGIILSFVLVFQVPEFLKSTYICHTNSTKALKYFIQRPGVINWSKPVILSGKYCLTFKSLIAMIKLEI